MKKLYVLAMSILLIISFPNFIYANNSDVPQKVQDAADRSLDSAKGLFTGNPEKWGFDSDEAIENITLSDGYKIRYLDEDKLMNYNNKTLMDVTFETDYWQYIIYLNGKPKTLLTVGPVENGGRWV